MLKYFLEIKNRIIILFITWFSIVLVCYFYKEILLFLFMFSYTNFNLTVLYFIFTDVTEVFSVYLNLILFLSFQITFLYFLYHLFIFLSPAFLSDEYKSVKFFLKILIFSWIFSIFLSTYILIPVSWNFFLSFQNFSFGQSIFFEARLVEYFNFYITFYFFCLIYCQVFSALFTFLKDVHLKKVYIKKFRKLYHYIFIIFATFFSPPEILSQILLSFFIISIYEIILLIFMLNFSLKILIRQ